MLWVTAVALLIAGVAGASDYTFEWQNPKPQGNGLYAMDFEDGLTGYAFGEKGANLVTTDGGVTWTDRSTYPDFIYDIEDVLVLGPGDLLAVGESPGIFRSLDGGASWTSVTNPSTDRLYDVHVIPGGTLSAIGDYGEIVQSTDGGATWVLIPQALNRRLFGQYWWDDSHGYVVGEHFLRSTDDGGTTWTPLPDAPENRTYTDIYFRDAMNGWFLGHFSTWRTTDGGTTWFEKHGPPGDSPIYQEEALFFDDQHRLIITFLEGAGIWETLDDGDTWEILYERINTAGYTDIERLPDGSLVVCSSDGDFLRSIDSGQTWENFTQSPEDGERDVLETITFLPSGKAFAGGRGSLWLRSDDWGETWEIPTANPGIATTRAIEFRNDDFGLAGGYTPSTSKILRTIDGGESWTSHSLAPSYSGYPREIAIPDDNVCYTVVSGSGTDHHVYRSADGGQTWEERDNGISAINGVDSIFFLDAETGFVGGESASAAAVWKTADGALSWELLPSAGLGAGAVFEMHWMNELTGVIAKSRGAYRTTDGGASWTLVIDDYTGPLDFRDDLYGIVANRYYPWVWVTDDGGVTWDRVDYSWMRATLDVAAVPEGFVGCGYSSVIYMGRESLTPVDEGDGGETPLRSRVLRVWPNPFNPMTKVMFTVPETGDVLITVHDVTGRRVAVLASGHCEAGELAITWDGKDQIGRKVASGVYFISAEAGGLMATAKIVLAK